MATSGARDRAVGGADSLRRPRARGRADPARGRCRRRNLACRPVLPAARRRLGGDGSRSSSTTSPRRPLEPRSGWATDEDHRAGAGPSGGRRSALGWRRTAEGQRMDRVRWGVLGAAKIAREWVCPGIHASDRGVVAAVASRTPGKAEALAGPYGARTHASYEALLDDPEIDAVYIPLPNDAHVEWTLKALDAGKHVLTEKPIALEAGEIDRLIAARDRSGQARRRGLHGHPPPAVAAHPRAGAGRRDRPARPGAERLHLHEPRPREHPQRRPRRRRGAARHRRLPDRHHPLRHRRRAGRGQPRRDRLGHGHRRDRAGDGGLPRTSTSTSTSRCGWRRARSWSSTARTPS